MKILSVFLILMLNLNTALAKDEKANLLVHESSPYLLQHAYNPVNWYPWGEDAFSRARKENKPVFISIGYSTCHWCHVMAHESFENNEIAALLNQHFISIKVDREERPDIDRIYLTATEILAGYGGWPTTIIANTELKPFFANTYMPAYSRDGQKGLKEILSKVTSLWKDDRKNVEKVANEVTEILRQHLQNKKTDGKVNTDSIKQAYLKFTSMYDSEHGGFSNAPKFPRMSVYDFLLAYGNQHKDSKAHDMVLTSLAHMLRGGIYDHIGGGFHRYSVDAKWQVPHFEKMLYDQGLITNTLIDAASLGHKQFDETIRQSLDFVLNQMRNKQGGFYSAYDADSTRPDNPDEHGEGAYYVWSKKQLDNLLSPEEQQFFYRYYNIQPAGNVFSDPQQEFTGLNILYAEDALTDVAKELSLPLANATTLLNSSLSKLRQQREKRPLPHLDDKIITAWNALVIKALTRAATHLNNQEYQSAAEDAARFIHQHLYNPVNQTLYRSYRNGKHSGEAYLDDYAYLINSLINLYQHAKDRQWLVWADTLMQKQITLFHDTKHHGFFDNSDSDKNILIRTKEIYDSALPSANAITVENLLQLSVLLNKPEWKTLSRQTADAFHENLNELYENYPQMYKSLLNGL